MAQTKENELTKQVRILALNGDVQTFTLDLVSSFNNYHQGRYLPYAVASYIFRRVYAYYSNDKDFDGDFWKDIVQYLRTCHPYYAAFLVGSNEQIENFCRSFCADALRYLQKQSDFSMEQAVIMDLIEIYFPENLDTGSDFYDYWTAYWRADTAMIFVTRGGHQKQAFKFAAFLQAQREYCRDWYDENYDTYCGKSLDYYRYIHESAYHNLIGKQMNKQIFGCLAELTLYQLMELAAEGDQLHQCYYCECYFVSQRRVKTKEEGWKAKCPQCDKAGREKSLDSKESLSDNRLYVDFQDYFMCKYEKSYLSEYESESYKLFDILFTLLSESDCFYIWTGKVLAFLDDKQRLDPDDTIYSKCQEMRKEFNAIKKVLAYLNVSSDNRTEATFLEYERFRKKAMGELQPDSPQQSKALRKTKMQITLLIRLLKCRIRTL